MGYRTGAEQGEDDSDDDAPLAKRLEGQDPWDEQVRSVSLCFYVYVYVYVCVIAFECGFRYPMLIMC